MVSYNLHCDMMKEMEMVEAKKSKKSKKHQEIPQRLQVLLRTRFWGQCEEHRGLRRSEENIFCLDCGAVLCPHCTHGNAGHRLLQVRRYVYRSVVRVDDIRKLLDLSKIQTYTINRCKAVHIRPMKQSPLNKAAAAGPHCVICGRSITNAPNRYCSIACKLNEQFDDAISSDFDDHSASEAPNLDPKDETEHCAQMAAATELSSCLLSPQPSDSSVANQGHLICLSLRRRARKQARPMRAPFS